MTIANPCCMPSSRPRFACFGSIGVVLSSWAMGASASAQPSLPPWPPPSSQSFAEPAPPAWQPVPATPELAPPTERGPGKALITTGVTLLLTGYLPAATSGAAMAASGADDGALNAVPFAGPFIMVGLMTAPGDDEGSSLRNKIILLEVMSSVLQTTGLALIISGAVTDGNAEPAASDARMIPDVEIGPGTLNARWNL